MTTERDILCLECNEHKPADEFVNYFVGEGVCLDCLAKELIAGSLDEGILIANDRACEIHRMGVIEKKIGDRWDNAGYLYEVVQNGDGTTWKPVAEAK